ncbi:uncharacterized protein C2845_PM14G20100 [Panicum miliaceum]|uniref:Uncharacterized protein n=1 Tax=Panicum miliaceum TaxID=4540 RepID=A0A3L6PQN4_PANMI|nr:uncharacterized protein C2845_PM14G20100 [Panicum miliaceum]
MASALPLRHAGIAAPGSRPVHVPPLATGIRIGPPLATGLLGGGGSRNPPAGGWIWLQVEAFVGVKKIAPAPAGDNGNAGITMDLSPLASLKGGVVSSELPETTGLELENMGRSSYCLTSVELQQRTIVEDRCRCSLRIRFRVDSAAL